MELTTRNLTKRYNDLTAVDSVDLVLTPGVWGILGPNGAGKTSLMKMICGLKHPCSGDVLVNGTVVNLDDEDYRDCISYLPQDFVALLEFDVEGYLEYIAALKGLARQQVSDRINYLLNKLSLTEVRKKSIRKLSGGTKQRVGIAQALLNKSKIIVLDEPTVGLDPKERVAFWNMISEIAQESIVLISTHIVADIEFVADNVLIMKEGKIISIDSIDSSIHKFNGRVWLNACSLEEYNVINEKYLVLNVREKDKNCLNVRYISETPYDNGSILQIPCLEDVYLSYFSTKRLPEGA